MGLALSAKGDVGLPLGICGEGEARAPNCPFGDASVSLVRCSR